MSVSMLYFGVVKCPEERGFGGSNSDGSAGVNGGDGFYTQAKFGSRCDEWSCNRFGNAQKRGFGVGESQCNLRRNGQRWGLEKREWRDRLVAHFRRNGCAEHRVCSGGSPESECGLCGNGRRQSKKQSQQRQRNL